MDDDCRYLRVGLRSGKHAGELDPFGLVLVGASCLAELIDDLDSVFLSMDTDLSELFRDGKPSLFLHIRRDSGPRHRLHLIGGRLRRSRCLRTNQRFKKALRLTHSSLTSFGTSTGSSALSNNSRTMACWLRRSLKADQRSFSCRSSGNRKVSLTMAHLLVPL